MHISRITLWILVSMGVFDFFEVAMALRWGWIYETPLAEPYLRERIFIGISAFVGLGICGGVVATRWLRSKWHEFTWRIGW